MPFLTFYIFFSGYIYIYIVKLYKLIIHHISLNLSYYNNLKNITGKYNLIVGKL